MSNRDAIGTDKLRSYPFTINNPGGFEWDGVSEFPYDPFALFQRAGPQLKYCIYSYECGTEGGTPHLQGWIQLSSPQRMGHMHKWGGEWEHASFRVQVATDQANVRYCSKKDDPTHIAGPWECGTRGGQGQRSDIQAAVDKLKETRSLKRVAEDHPVEFVKYTRGLREYLEVTSTAKRSWKTEVKILYGDAGTGKTRMAHESDPDAYYLRKGNGGAVWWDGYLGQATIIVDDFYGWIPYDLLLRICDRYPLRVDLKGGSTEFLGRTIWITSNRPWQQWYNFDENSKLCKEAFERRIDELWYFEKGKEPVKEQ